MIRRHASNYGMKSMQGALKKFNRARLNNMTNDTHENFAPSSCIRSPNQLRYSADKASQVTYQNILPSNIIHGSNYVLPLYPTGHCDKNQDVVRKLIENSTLIINQMPNFSRQFDANNYTEEDKHYKTHETYTQSQPTIEGPLPNSKIRFDLNIARPQT